MTHAILAIDFSHVYNLPQYLKQLTTDKKY